VILRAVANCEINSNQLKAGIAADGHLSSIRRSLTARVVWRAVAFAEMSFTQLKARI
jgi:hypothetical protein